MKLKTFLLYAEAAPQIDLLSNEEAGQLFKALFHYVADGTELVTDNRVLAMTFAVFKAQIDRGATKYEEICQKRKEAANRKWEIYRSTNESNSMQMDANESNSMQMDANESNSMQMDANDTREGNNNPNPNPKPNPQNKKESTKKKDAAHAAALMDGRKEDFYNSLIPFVTQYGKEMVRAFFDYCSEPNKSRTKMRFELERTWDLPKRLGLWKSREKQFNHNGNGTNDNRGTSESRAQDAANLIASLAAEE